MTKAAEYGKLPPSLARTAEELAEVGRTASGEEATTWFFGAFSPVCLEAVMATESSFDIVCRVEMSECDNAIQQAMKEVAQRFDFKGTRCSIRRDEAAILLQADDENRLRSLTELLEGKLVKRKVPLKALGYGTVEPAAGGTVRQRVAIQQGIPVEKAREIVKHIKASGLKVQAQIREDEVRVSGKSKDVLQTIIQALRERDLGIELQFTNYR